jgi:DNA-binding LacI/PurR family transcriptional regulator
MPAVLVDQPPIEGIPSIGIDDEGAARSAAEHLLTLGHRRFGVVTFELAPGTIGGIADLERQRAATYRPSRARLRGYASALEAAGVSWEGVPVYECAENAVAEGKVAAGRLLSEEPEPTALLVTSDQLALGVLEAAKEMGLSVPGDLSVAGFDDIPEAARTAPALTTVNQPHVEKGLLAGRLLVAQIDGEEAPSPPLLPTRLVVRGSTARAADL